MRKLVKHLRPFIWSILAISVLLFAQAMSDLSLPSYMSRIVNVGVQQNGIEDAVPQVIRASEMMKLTPFMTDIEMKQVSADYILLDRQSLSPSDYAKYVKSYPALATAPLYQLDTSDKTQKIQLDTIFSKYLPVLAITARGGNAAQLDALPQSQIKLSMIAYISAEYKAIGMNMSGIQTSFMLRIGLLMLLLTIAAAVCSVAVGYLSARIAAGLGRDLRRKLFVRVESFSNTEFDKFSTASLITRTTNDITQIQMLMVMLFRMAFYAPILGIGGIIKVMGEDRSMLWIIAAAVGLMVAFIITAFSIVLPRFNLIQSLMDKLNLITREMLSGLMVIRAFNTQKHEEEKFDATNIDMTKVNLFVNRISVFMMPLMMLVMNAAMLLIVWVGSHQVDTNSMQVGDMMAFMQYAVLIISSFMMLAFMFMMVPRASVSAVRISEVLETEPTINDPKEPQKFTTNLKGVVEFKNVSFRYPGAEEDVLENITFTAKPGQTTAFIGSTGSGKSTLINLIPRFYDVTEGQVLIDGVDVREVTQHDLREKISYVPQKAVLFSGSIKSNIKYADENATDEDVARYAETAQALDFITTSERGFSTRVSQGGANLSGGQRQRLSIARALAKNPEIYIFDDALSALDFKTDATLRKALRKETSSATLLIVTQRISTVMGAEQIVVLDDGKVVGTGTHKELMESCKVYYELAMSQMSREELVS